MIWLQNIVVMKMNKRVELPLIEPLYETYHYQGPATAILSKNPSVRNWYLNEAVILACDRKFLSGYTTPLITVVGTSWDSNPYIEKRFMSSEFIKGYINPVIRELLDNGFYVIFADVDDYYIKGKSWYKERHFNHDGMICGYDKNDKTFCIYAYDSNWIYKKFWTPQKDFNAGRAAARREGRISRICGIRVKNDKVDFSPTVANKKIKEYLDSDLKKYSFKGDGNVYGIVVHRYIAEYIRKLHQGDIPYERMDRRVFRVIWEHKKVMLERIEKMEESLRLDNKISEKYKRVVSEADAMRMLYASHHMKRRDSILPIIEKKLLHLMKTERKLLTSLVKKVEEELQNETVELFEE